VGSPCSGVNWNYTQFYDCPCEIDIDVSLSVDTVNDCFRVFVNGTQVTPASPTYSGTVFLDCDETYDSSADVQCSCTGPVNVIAQIGGECFGDCDCENPT